MRTLGPGCILPQLEATAHMNRHLLALVIAAGMTTGCSNGTNPLSPAAAPIGSAGAAAKGGPASYDANGPWFGLFSLGAQVIGEGTHIFTQAQSGSLTAVGSEPIEDPEHDWRTYSFKRVGSPSGTVRDYRLTITGQGPTEACATDLSGTAQLNTETNRIEATATGVLPNCATATITIVWVKQ